MHRTLRDRNVARRRARPTVESKASDPTLNRSALAVAGADRLRPAAAAKRLGRTSALAVLLLAAAFVVVSFSLAFFDVASPTLYGTVDVGGTALHSPAAAAANSNGNATKRRPGSKEPRRTMTGLRRPASESEVLDAGGGGGGGSIGNASDPEATAGTTSHGGGGISLPPPMSTVQRGRRFPRYGTPAFLQECGWAMHRKSGVEVDVGNGVKRNNAVVDNCTLLVRPDNSSGEGIAHWMSSAVSGYLQAIQVGCALRIDYGPGVNITEALVPPADGGVDRTAPPMFECSPRARCWRAPVPFAVFRSHFSRVSGTAPGIQFPADVPDYRYAYRTPLNQQRYLPLHRALPAGFSLDNGAACSLGDLFDLSTSAGAYVPELFDTILPALRDEESLVLALYVRTGWTDVLATAEEKGISTKKLRQGKKLGESDENVVRCALRLEERHIAEGGTSFPQWHRPRPPRVVWMVVTDSAATGGIIASLYSGPNRTVLTTSSRGVQTRPTSNPNTADFVQAIVDWYLLGESDAVVTTGRSKSFVPYSFAFMGALRTSRPLFDATGGTCEKKEFLRGGLG